MNRVGDVMPVNIYNQDNELIGTEEVDPRIFDILFERAQVPSSDVEIIIRVKLIRGTVKCSDCLYSNLTDKRSTCMAWVRFDRYFPDGLSIEDWEAIMAGTDEKLKYRAARYSGYGSRVHYDLDKIRECKYFKAFENP